LIAADGDRNAAAFLGGANGFRAVGDVRDDDLCALCSQPLAEGLPDAVGAARHDSAFPGRHIGVLPVFLCRISASKHFGFWQLQVDYPKIELFPKYFRRRAYAVKAPAG